MYWITADSSRTITILMVLANKLVHFLGPVVPQILFSTVGVEYKGGEHTNIFYKS